MKQLHLRIARPVGVMLGKPQADEWQKTCQRMLEAGFLEAESFNPYWQYHGRTFKDPDGYRIMLQQAAWE